MYHLLFVLYFGICSFIISRVKFIRDSGLSSTSIIVLFALKIAAGLLLGWIFQKFYGWGNDYWDLNAYGVEEYQLMVTDPWHFATNLFRARYEDTGAFFGSTGSFWNDLENNLIIKVLAVFNIFSRGNYYINSLLFNTLGFFGHVAIFRIFLQLYSRQKTTVIIGCFLLPSALFFTSGLNKDNTVFTLLCLFCYAVFFGFKYGFTLKRVLLAIIAYAGILLMRNYVAVVLLPGLLAWMLSRRLPVSKQWGFASVFLGIVLGTLALSMLFPAFDPAKVVAQKQQDFFSLGVANTQLPTDTLSPGIVGILKNAPQALNHGFLRPYVWESRSLFTTLQAVELSAYLGLFLVAVWTMFSLPSKVNFHPFLLFIIISCCIVLMLIGYIVPNTNSIVRYRSIYLPFLLTPVLCQLQTFWSNRQINI